MHRKLISLTLAALLFATLLVPLSTAAESGGKPVKITGDYNGTFMLTENRRLWSWGYNMFGLLNDTVARNTPTAIMDGVADASAGSDTFAVVKTDGTLWTWGSNSHGQLGDGTTKDRLTPLYITENVRAVSVNNTCMMFIKQDRSLWASGKLYEGIAWSIPTKLMENVESVSLGGSHAAILNTDGSLWTIGRNNMGQLGDGSKENRAAPVKVSAMNQVSKVCADGFCTMVIKTDGSLWGWGGNARYALGDGTTNDATVSNPVHILDNAAEVNVSGNWGASALKNDGTVWLWGYFISIAPGNPEDGVLDDCITTPKQVMNNAAHVTGSPFEATVVDTSGTVWVSNAESSDDITFTKKWSESMAADFRELTIPEGPEVPTEPEVPADHILVPSDKNPAIYINLTTESLHLNGFRYQGYSLDGVRWKKGQIPTGKRLENLFNKGFTLHLASKMTAKGKKMPAEDAEVVTFGTIEKRPKHKIKIYYSDDSWFPVDKKDSSNTPLSHGFEWSRSLDKKNPTLLWEPVSGGFAVGATKAVYFIRSSAVFANESYIPASKAVKLKPKAYKKMPRIKYNEDWFDVKPQKHQMSPDGETWYTVAYDGDNKESIEYEAGAKGVSIAEHPLFINAQMVYIRLAPNAKNPPSRAFTRSIRRETVALGD